MSKEIKSILLGTASGAGVGTGERKQLIDLDETYEDEHTQKDVDALATYLKTGKLSKEALVNNNVAGQERFEPGCTTLNGLLGGESFISKLNEKVSHFIKRSIEIIASVIKWVMGRLKWLLDFVSDAREVQKGDAILREIEEKLMKMGGPAFNVVDLRELFADEPASARRVKIIRALRTRNQKTLESVVNLQKALPELKAIVRALGRQDQNISATEARFRQGVNQLRKRVKQNALTVDDLKTFIADVGNLISNNLQIDDLKTYYAKITQITSNRNVHGVDVDAQFRASVEQQNKAMESTKDEVSINDIAELAMAAGNIRKEIAENPNNFTLDIAKNDFDKLSAIVSMEDLAFIEEVSKEMGDQVLLAVYRNFVGKTVAYSTAVRECIQLAVRYTEEVKYLSEWSQRYELILGIMSLKTVEERMAARRAYQEQTGETLDTANLKDVPEDGMSATERGIYNLYDSLLPGVKSLMNKLSRKLNAGVTVK